MAVSKGRKTVASKTATLAVGDRAPDFTLPGHRNGEMVRRGQRQTDGGSLDQKRASVQFHDWRFLLGEASTALINSAAADGAGVEQRH